MLLYGRRVLAAVVVLLASCQTALLPLQALTLDLTSINVSNTATSPVSLRSVTPATDYSSPDARAGAVVEDVFRSRLGHILSNVTLRTQLESALDIILQSPEELRSTFSNAPPGSQLLQDPFSGSPAALRAITISRALSAALGSTTTSAPTARVNAIDPHFILGSLNQLADQLAKLSPGSCHPITRRVILAALTRLQLWTYTPGALSPETAAVLASGVAGASGSAVGAQLFRIYRLLFEGHRRGAASKGAIEFLHISKSGGTSMCSVADRNGCSAESTTKFGNCMVRRFDDRPRWISAAVHNETGPLPGWRWYYRYLVPRGERTCEYRDEFMQRMNYSFYSNEFASHGGLQPPLAPSSPPLATGADPGAASSTLPPWSSAHLCPQFLNIVMLRHPLARMLSHVLWIMKVYRMEYGRTYEPFFRGRDADYWRRFAPAAVDNYYVRLLLGEGTFYAPAETINATHLAAAQLMLLQYDVVLLLEAPDIDGLWLRQALGWRAGLASAKARVAGQPRSLMELLPYDMDELMAGSAEDVQLYEFAAVVHQLDGLMFAAVAAAGIQPYDRYDEIDPALDKQEFRRRVACGYVTRRRDFLSGRGYNMTALRRKYRRHYPRLFAADEKVPNVTAARAGRQQRQKRHTGANMLLHQQPPLPSPIPQQDGEHQQQLPGQLEKDGHVGQQQQEQQQLSPPQLQSQQQLLEQQEQQQQQQQRQQLVLQDQGQTPQPQQQGQPQQASSQDGQGAAPANRRRQLCGDGRERGRAAGSRLLMGTGEASEGRGREGAEGMVAAVR